jgi:chromatin remodeling complex protein RSC6
LDIDAVKKEVATGNTLKKKKALWEAFEIAAQEHDLQHFKDVLNEHEKAMAADVEERAAVEVKKQETKEKKKRKSLATVEDDDVDMEDAEDDDGETPAKKKQTKKRKKTDESEGEGEKVCLRMLRFLC